MNKVLAKAHKLIEAGRGKEIMPHTDFLYCPGAPVSAASIVSYYGSRRSVRSLPAQLDNLNVPTLVVAAGEDNLEPDTAAIIKPYTHGKRIQLVAIDGASYFFCAICFWKMRWMPWLHFCSGTEIYCSVLW